MKDTGKRSLLGGSRAAVIGAWASRLVMTLALGGCSTANATKTDSSGPRERVAARIGAETITLGELDRIAAAEIFELRSVALHRALTSRLIDVESAERGIKRSELRKLEVEQKVPAPSVDEALATVRQWVAEGKLSKDEAAQMAPAQAQERVRRVRLREREEAFFDELFERRAVALDFGALGKPELRIQTEGPSVGSPDAKVTLVEFADLTNSFTAQWQPTLERLMEKHRGQVRFLFKQKTASESSPGARVAAAALCAHEQGRYWEFRQALFRQQAPVTEASSAPAAQHAGLDLARFEACVRAGSKAAHLARDAAEVQDNGLEGDPVIAINGIRLSGAHPFSTVSRLLRFEAAAKPALAETPR